MGISAIDPIGPAMNGTGRMLFKPFQFTKWLVLGFAAFLAYLAEGLYSNSNSIPWPGPPVGQTLPQVVNELKRWFLGNVHWVLPVAFTSLLLWVVITWIRARGKFIFLDCVVRNQAAIVEPWKRLRTEGNSFFWFDLLLSWGMMLAVIGLLVLTYAIALPDLHANTMGSAGVTAIVLGLSLFLLLAFGYALVLWVAEDFLIPVMYVRSQRIGPAWTEFRTRILAGHVGVIALFGLMRLLLGFAAAMIVMVGTIVTCCLAGIPYVDKVVFAPLYVFGRAYALYFLAQFGSEYALMLEIPAAPPSAFPVIFNAPPMPPPPLEPLTPESLAPDTLNPPPLPPPLPQPQGGTP